MRHLRVYTASKLHYAPMWRELRVDADWRFVHFTARWPFMTLCEFHASEAAPQARHFWMHDEHDVAQSDVVLVYAEPEDHLRGALVEAGMALGAGKRVLLVGENEGFGTWQWHPRVGRVSNLHFARGALAGLQIDICADASSEQF